MKRPVTLLAASSLTLGALVAPALVPSAAAAPAAPSAPQRAVAAAAALVAARPAAIHPGAGDAYVAHAAQSGAKGLQYVPYDRTYRGLEVLGGDFVVVTDAQGKVLSTSTGRQQRALSLATATTVTPAAAAAVAKRQLAGGTVARTTEIVDATTATPAVAYESVVTGYHGAVPSKLHVVVDGTTGKVRTTWDEVSEGTGTAAYNGPNPVSITTSGSGSSYSMTDASRPGLSCRNFSSKAVLTGTDDAWGNGNPASIETGCVDALYDVQHEWSMLGTWLGRNGINGSGRGFPIYVGLDDENAYWDGSGVSIGHNTSNQYISAQDVTGHEFGHAIDSNTPGGQSGNGVSEATGDIFGTSLEFFSNQSSSFDAPDWTIGEEVNLVGSGPIRNMANPGTVGDPVCYSSSIPGAETHAAAGPFDHWFYLVAGGQAAAGGSKVSQCNGATVSGGLGVQQALTVFYNAMLAKTSGMTYLKYRTATLTAAKNLGGGSCAAFNTVKAAWDAVKVPAQSADPTCTGSGTVSVSNPGNKTASTGTAISPFTLTASPTGSYTWSATGLPSGISIGSSTGTVSGTPTAAGTFTVTATATNGSGASGSTTFLITVAGTGGACSSPGQKLTNPGFETSGGWTTSSGVISSSTSSRPSHTGTKLAYLDGYGSSTTDTATQSVTIPAGCAVTVTYWYRIITSETTASTAYDTLSVKYGGATLATYSNLNKNSAYAQASFSVSPASGAQTLSFTGVEDNSLQTSFLVDDVAVTVS
ncbi:M4 family metallopeptidase [Jatrophihabitans sp. YIM 134969]